MHAVAGCVLQGGTLLLHHQGEVPTGLSISCDSHGVATHVPSQLWRHLHRRGLKPITEMVEPNWTQAQKDLALNCASASQDQAQIIQDICARLSKTEQVLALITALRGRGKSHLLADIVVSLLPRFSRILLIAGVAKQQAVLSKRLAQLTGHLDEQIVLRTGQMIQHKTGVIALLPPDHPACQTEWDVIIIDEAASFPIEVLQDLLHKATHHILATTTHGYEGSASGFAHKFMPQLRHAVRYTLTTPVRFTTPCPIETLLHQEAPQSVMVEDGIYQLSQLTAHAMRAQVIEQIYRLLRLAHYQTRPDDLQRLWDDPYLDSLVYIQQGRCVAAVAFFDEHLQHLPDTLQTDITIGKRRIQGHLVSQQLAMTFAAPQFHTTTMAHQPHRCAAYIPATRTWYAVDPNTYGFSK